MVGPREKKNIYFCLLLLKLIHCQFFDSYSKFGVFFCKVEDLNAIGSELYISSLDISCSCGLEGKIQ